MHTSRLLRVCGAFCLLHPFPALVSAEDFSISVLVVEGQFVDGVGSVSRIDNLAVNNAGDWIVEADTTADSETDAVLLRNGVLYLREADALDDPNGASIDFFDTVNISNDGDSGWNFSLDGTDGFDDDSGVYFNTTLVIQESDASTADELSPGTPYVGFFEVKISGNALLLMASVDDPAIASSVDRVLMRVEVDDAGALLLEAVEVKEGDVLPGQKGAVLDFETGPHEFALNAAGDTMYIAVLDDATDRDRAIYINDNLVAQEGEVAPDGERLYQTLTRPLAFNAQQDYVFKADLDGDTASDYVLIRNGEIYRQEGGTIDAIAPFAFEGSSAFGSVSGPVAMDHCGNVLYYAEWDDPDTTRDSGLFLNEQLVVQEGVSEIDGQVLESLSSVQDAFALSENGRFTIFEGTLAGGLDGAFLIEFIRCPDFDGSGTIDLPDLSLLLGTFGNCVGDDGFVCAADLDFSGCVDLADLSRLLAGFGGPCD